MENRGNHVRRPLYISVPFGYSNIYTGGDPLRGVVRVDPKTRCQRITITFRGRCKCSITVRRGKHSTTYKEKPDFFSSTVELFSSATDGASYDILNLGVTTDNKVEIPFEFQWPDKIELEPAQIWTKSPRFEHEAGGPLPPTYKYFSFGGDEQAVEYFLEAKLYVSSKIMPQIEVRCPLIFRPAPPADFSGLAPTAQALRPISTYQRERGTWVRTHKLHPDYNPNEIKLLDRIRLSWTKNDSSTPTANFRIEPTCQSTITSGHPLHLRLSLTHISRSDVLPDPPPIFLRKIQVELHSRLYVRVPRDSVFRGSINELATHEEKVMLLERRFEEGDGMLIYDGTPVRTKKFPVEIAPPFVSWGLVLQHTVEVRIWGECGKEKFGVPPMRERVGVAVSGRPWRRGSEAAVGANGEPPAIDGDVPPPIYVESH